METCSLLNPGGEHNGVTILFFQRCLFKNVQTENSGEKKNKEKRREI